MITRSKLQYLRITPRKVRLVADMIRGKKVEEAQTLLRFTIKRGVEPMLKLLNSAVSNATGTEASNLYISKVIVDGGPINKRWRARSRGMAARIQKKTSHITIELSEIDQPKAGPPRAGKTVKPKKEIKTEAKKEKPKFNKSEEVKPSSTKATAGRGLKKIFRRKSI